MKLSDDIDKAIAMLEEVEKIFTALPGLDCGSCGSPNCRALAIASDHGGFLLKGEIIKYLEDNNIEYKDFGTYSEASVDYPDFALAVAESVAAGNTGYLGI